MSKMQKIEAEYELKLSADKYFDACKNHITQFTKYLPEVFKSVQVLEGDGITVGSVKLWNYILDGKICPAKERTTLMDNKSRSLTWSFFDGEMMNYYKSFELKLISVTPKGEGSCVAKYVIEFEKKNEDVPDPTFYLGVMGNVSKKF